MKKISASMNAECKISRLPKKVPVFQSRAQEKNLDWSFMIFLPHALKLPSPCMFDRCSRHPPRSRGTTKRHFLRPKGWTQHKSTAEGNRLARRLCCKIPSWASLSKKKSKYLIYVTYTLDFLTTSTTENFYTATFLG